MATSKMIDQALWQPRPAAGSDLHAASLTLHQPRADQDAEAAEHAKAGRSMVRLALGRHDCVLLPACPAHGRELCGCVTCDNPAHAGDVDLLDLALKASGLRDEPRDTHRDCSVCHKPRRLDRFAHASDVCKYCQADAKAARKEADHGHA
ncbi:hypothetical protein [Nonomuraea indica]|uniref:hypothetical protein n=1 Tax=Nonomuraea indica TaxID=1581193 RepID=UPI0011845B87|nr:hypothetical protein [Nonomuraea indica]